MLEQNERSVLGRREFLALSGSAALAGVVAICGRSAIAGCVGSDSCDEPPDLQCNQSYDPVTYAIGNKEELVDKECGVITTYTDCTQMVISGVNKITVSAPAC